MKPGPAVVQVKRLTDDYLPKITVTFVNDIEETFDATLTPAQTIRNLILDKGSLLETEQMFRKAGEQCPVIVPEEELRQPFIGIKFPNSLITQVEQNCLLHPVFSREAVAILGYDAAICATKWHDFGKVSGGEHEFIDVITHQNSGCSEQYIIDIDFQSHFQIARAIKSYYVLSNSLPSIYIGTTAKLKQFLQIMVEAAKYSLEQNSMSLPPWRSLAYLEAKWESPCERIVFLMETSLTAI